MCYSENIIIPCEVNGRMVHALVYFMQGLGSCVYFNNADRSVNAKSIIGVLSFGLHKGSEFTIAVVNKHDDNTGKEELYRAVKYIRGLGDD